MHRRQWGWRLGALAIVGTFGLAACGGGGGSGYTQPKGPAKKTVSVDATNFKFTPDTIQLPAGVDAIKATSQSGAHTFVIQGVKGFKLKMDGTGQSDELRVDLKPGTYTFYCDIPGHRESGMQGKITVS